MTKSTITREQVVALIAEHSYDSALVDALEHLLSAMDSEPVEMPLDYLQGHKDGLEWASQLAEANHPETGDWIYDDPIELAKAIRKGPDMPPVQPVADSEPDRNPVLAYADSYRDMAKQGVESVPIWSVITDLERNIAPLYRHAQPAPVVPEEKPIPNTLSMYAVDAVAAIAEVKGWNACRAAMLQASPVCTCPSGDGSLRWPCPVHPGNSPAQSDCCPAQNSVNPAQGGNYLVIPDEMTSEQAYEIGYYYGDPVDVFARGANWMRQHIIDSTLAAAPQSPGSEPATVPGKWIPVSERMPERGDYLVTDGCDFDVQLFNGEQFIPGFVWEDKITHWMPLPAAPQEVKGE
ncbi:DUF551 domain-containing protein [Klebsiella pneumoniae]